MSILSILGCQSAGNGSSRETEADRIKAFQAFPDALYPIRKGSKWGYMNRKGETVIAPTYASAEDFESGIAVVSVSEKGNTRYGYINRKGEWVIQPQFDRADPFFENRASVCKNDKYGYIDSKGVEIIPCQFEAAGRFSEGRAAIQKNGWTGFIDSTGTIVIEPRFTVSVNHPIFDQGMAPVFGADEMTGFINPSGEWVIEPRFHSAGRFREDKAWASFQETDDSAQYGFTIRGGYIDRQGDWVILPEYDFGWDFFEGHATVWKISEDRQQKLWSVIDTSGEKVLENLPYRNMGSITNGLIPVQDEKMAWGFINLKGEVVIPPKYTGINRFRDGLARMEVGSAFDPEPVYINERGEIVMK